MTPTYRRAMTCNTPHGSGVTGAHTSHWSGGMMKRRSLILFAATLLGVTPLIGCASDVPTALFLGDSYTAGVELPADDITDRWPSRLSQNQGWMELNKGCAGAGYT